MGSYLNPGSKGFQESLNSEIYMDKTGLIEKTNAVLNTGRSSCVLVGQGVLESQWQQICWLRIMTGERIPPACLRL